MGHDVWVDELRDARGDPGRLAAFLAAGVPDDDFEQAGNAVLAVGAADDGLRARLVGQLRARDWRGDAELADDLEGIETGLVALVVDVFMVSEALDESDGAVAMLELSSGSVGPGEILELGDGPDEHDLADSSRRLPVPGEGSGETYRVMRRFAGTVADDGLRHRLAGSLDGGGAFKRFLGTVERVPGEFTRWHRYREDAGLGQARAWLAEHGCRPDPTCL